MKLNYVILLYVFIMACQTQVDQRQSKISNDVREIITEDFELFLPSSSPAAVLILFGGFPETPKVIQKEFGLKSQALQNDVGIVYMNFNQKLWLDEADKATLVDQLEDIFDSHALSTSNIYLGGFSSGGNVSFLLANELAKRASSIAPKGVFVIDAPIDLVALYKSSEKNVQRNFSEVSVQESTFLLDFLSTHIGRPHTNLAAYESKAVYTSATHHIQNLHDLKDTKIRLYTEPDTTWWKDHRMADYDQMNAFYLQHLAEDLISSDFTKVELITTSNKGYRANGNRHPHSWSIVDKEALIQWMLP